MSYSHMLLCLSVVNKHIIATARLAFPLSYHEQFVSHRYPDAALVARYITMEYIASHTSLRETIPMGCYCSHGYYNSYSYTGDVVLIAVAKEKIGVDIERVMVRDAALLTTYTHECARLPGGERDRFYMMRTAKEALVKYLDATFDALESMEVIGWDRYRICYDSLECQHTIDLFYAGHIYTVSSGRHGEFQYAVMKEGVAKYSIA